MLFGSPGEAYNLANRVIYSIKHLANLLSTRYNVPIHVSAHVKYILVILTSLF